MRFDQVNDLLKPGYLAVESGVVDHDDGFKTVCALTRMPRCKAEDGGMVVRLAGRHRAIQALAPRRPSLLAIGRGGTAPAISASRHLVHEYLAGRDGPVYKLRINFRHPHEFFDPPAMPVSTASRSVPGSALLEAPVNLGLMTHFVRNTPQGCEMRSRFFLGHVESRDPDHPILARCARHLRHENVTAELARRLHHHATEEMSYLSEILPVLYRR